MEEDKDNNEKKFKQLENMKNKEIELMNQKIKNFEVIVEENSQNYLNEIKMLKLQIQNNKSKLEECNKYVEIVNFFINKIDYIFGIQSKQIYDIDELQNKFIQIENLVQKILNNQSKMNDNYNMNNDNKIQSFNNSKINDENINNKKNQNEEINDDNKSDDKDINNENYNQLKVPHFQNEILEQGLCNNHQITNREEDKYKIFKNLEQRIIDLEKKIYHSPNKEIQNNKIKKNHKSNINSNQNKIIYSTTYHNNEKNNSKNKVLRSKSSGKINYEKQSSNQIQYKSSNSNQINYNQYKKGKKGKKTQRKKNSTNKHEISTYTLNNNDNCSISNYSTYSNLKNNLAK